MQRSTKAKLSERRRQVADYALQGWTQAAIARHMNLPPATVCRDLEVMREYWREYSLFNFEKARLEQLQKIDLVETEAWAAWRRSQEPQSSASITRGKTGEQSRSSLKHQFGDHRFLREVSRCIGERSHLIGLKAPDPPPPTPPEEQALAHIKGGRARLFVNYLVLREQFGGPPFAGLRGLADEEVANIVELCKGNALDYLRRKFWMPGFGLD